MAAGGVDALEWDSERSQGGKAAREWLRTKANSIEGGTSEIQLGIIAKHILRAAGGLARPARSVLSRKSKRRCTRVRRPRPSTRSGRTDDLTCRSTSPTTRRCSARRRASFMADEGAIAKQLRHWRDIGCKDGFGHGLWKQFAELGFTGICIPEADGGLGLGAIEAAMVLEEIGRNLTPSPFLTTAVVAARRIEGHRARRALVSRHPRGRRRRGARDRRGPEARARGDRDDGRSAAATASCSTAQAVRRPGRLGRHDRHGRADGRIARRDDGITLFAVPKDADGLEVEGVALADSSAARLTFDKVEVDADAVIGEVDGGWAAAAARARRRPRRRRGGAGRRRVGAMAMTVDYLKQRKQFGRLIGEFQALQHRAAHLYSEIEIARAAALKAQQLLDEGDDGRRAMVSVAKAKAADVAKLAVQEGVQMHGGIGMTDEYDIGLYMKRDAVLGELFGDVYYHRDRVAGLSGY